MAKIIDRAEVQRLSGEGVKLVEVLPAEEYLEDHLPGAVSLPLRHLEKEYQTLDASRPVIVYCWDSG